MKAEHDTASDAPTDIPSGIYCYSIVEVEPSKTGPRVKITPCPYWKALEADSRGFVTRARCAHLNVEDEEERSLSLLWDQVKLCGVRDDPEEADLVS